MATRVKARGPWGTILDEIKRADSNVIIEDEGTGAIIFSPDNTEMFRITASAITFPGTGDFEISDGDLYVLNPSDSIATIHVGETGSHSGQIFCYGPPAGWGGYGGIIKLFTADDFKANADHLVIQIFENDFYFGVDTHTNAMIFDTTNEIWRFESDNGIQVGAANAQDTQYNKGVIRCLGEPTGSDDGGELYLQTADDHDTTIAEYGFKVQEDDLWIGPDTDPDLVKISAEKDFYITDGDMYIDNPSDGVAQMFLGSNDTRRGLISVYGATTGNTTGGQVRLFASADHDATIDYYSLNVESDDLIIGPDTNTDLLKLTAEKDFYLTDGDMYVRNPTDGAATISLGGGVNGRGVVRIYGAPTGSAIGGIFELHTADDHDATIGYYQFKAESDDLKIGPNTDTDSLKYDGGNDQWEINAVNGVKVFGNVEYNDAPADVTASGDMFVGTVDTNTNGVGNLCHLESDGNFGDADADAEATCSSMLAIALETGTGTKKLLTRGFVRNDTWNWTVGAVLYADTGAGLMTETAPSGSTDIVRVVGYAYTADIVFFDPAKSWVEVA